MRASEMGRDECLTCVQGLRTGQDHPGADQPIRSRCPSRSQTTFMSKKSESQSQNAWSEELEDKLQTWPGKATFVQLYYQRVQQQDHEKPGSPRNIRPTGIKW